MSSVDQQNSEDNNNSSIIVTPDPLNSSSLGNNQNQNNEENHEENKIEENNETQNKNIKVELTESRTKIKEVIPEPTRIYPPSTIQTNFRNITEEDTRYSSFRNIQGAKYSKPIKKVRHIKHIIEVPKEIVEIPYEEPYEVIKKVEVPVFVPQYIDKVVEKKEPYEVKIPFPVDKVVEKRIEVQKIKEVKVEVKVPVYHDKIVEVKVPFNKEVPEYIDKIVEKKVPVKKEVPVYIDRIVEKKTYVPVQPKDKLIYQLQTRIIPIKIPQNVNSQQDLENYIRNTNLNLNNYSPISEINQLQYEKQNNNKDAFNIFQSRNEKEKTYVYEKYIRNAVQEPFSSNIIQVQPLEKADK